MPRLPPLSGREVVRALERIGFRLVSQNGSHIKVRRGAVAVIVPNHREVGEGARRLAGRLDFSPLSSDAIAQNEARHGIRKCTTLANMNVIFDPSPSITLRLQCFD